MNDAFTLTPDRFWAALYVRGTRRRIHIRGFDIRSMDENGLILESGGSFSSADYQRQLAPQ